MHIGIIPWCFYVVCVFDMFSNQHINSYNNFIDSVKVLFYIFNMNVGGCFYLMNNFTTKFNNSI